MKLLLKTKYEISLPKNYTLYRSSHHEAQQAVSYVNKAPNYLRNLPVFFLYGTNGKNIASRSYGGRVTVYTTKRRLRLLNIAIPRSIRLLLNSTNNPIVQKSIVKAFRVQNNKSVVRSSKMKYDIHVANLVCRLGYDGYFTRRMRSKHGSFHQEIMLCHPKTCIKVQSVLNANKPPPIRRRKALNNNNIMNNIHSIGNFKKLSQ
jgi:hypothetical protein